MTAAEFAAVIGTIQNAIAGILAAAVPKARVHNRWIMDSNRDQWAALLESDADTYDAIETEGDTVPKTFKRVHAITVAYYGLQLPAASSQQLQSISAQPTFAVDFFYDYEAGDDTNNSESVLRLDTGVGVISLWKVSDLGIRPLVKGHTQLQMPPGFDVIPLGGRLVHKASGTITVLMQSTGISLRGKTTMEFLLSDLQIAMSLHPETAINTPYSLTADFIGMRANALPPHVPQVQTVDNMDMIGGGDEFADDVRLYNWLQQPITLSGKLNTETASNWLLRALMGTITDAVVTAAASYDHSVPMQTRAQGRTPKYTTLVMNLGGADVVLASMAVNSFSISQQGTNEPQFSVEVIGAGSFRRMRDIAPAIVPPYPATHRYFHGAAAVIVLNDGVVKNLSSLGVLRSWSVGIQNNLVVGDRRPGDPFKTTGDVKTGAYVRSLLRGKRTASAQIKIALDENLSQLDWLTANTSLTSLSIKNVGEPIGATPEKYEVEWKVPKFKVQTITGDSEGDDATVTLNFLPLRDVVSGGLVTARVRNDQATMD